MACWGLNLTNYQVHKFQPPANILASLLASSHTWQDHLISTLRVLTTTAVHMCHGMNKERIGS
jgi:hypothetical protein